MYQQECDVFIAGSGVSGLYAAIILSKTGLSVHITENRSKQTTKEDTLIVFSPRSIQLLHDLDLLNVLTEKGAVRHWKFSTYHNKGYGTNATTIEEASIRLWDNHETADFNYSLSIPESIFYDILVDYLLKECGIQIDAEQEIIDIEEKAATTRDTVQPCSFSTSDLAMYYQYRPLPVVPTELVAETKTIHLKDPRENISTWKSQVIIGADGQTSKVRQKLGLSFSNHHTSSTNQRVFYTLQIKIVSTNFPGVRQMSTLCKNKDIIYILGYQTTLYITFEHKAGWSKVSVDDEIPIQTTLRHVKAMMDPWQIEFGKVMSYTRWNGNNQNTCEEYSHLTNYFFLGSAAQTLTPPGLFDINIHLDQARNLCWKLALLLQHNASPKLLATFHQETNTKLDEALHVSNLFNNFIGDYYQEENGATSINASHSRDLIYQLKRFKNCFVGTTPLTTNLLNDDETDMLSILEPPDNASTPSFEFIPPPNSLSSNVQSASFTHISSINLATPGYLAPNAKLKPYTLFQLLLISSSSSSSNAQAIAKPSLTPKLSSDEIIKQDIEIIKKTSKTPPPVSSNSNVNTNERQRSNSVTSSSTIWSMFQKGATIKKRNMSLFNSPNSNTSTTPASVLISPDRWKSIKTNYLELLDCIQSNNKAGCTFTLLFFCGSIHETQEKTRQIINLMNSSASFLHRFERLISSQKRYSVTSFDHRRHSSVSIATDHRSSFSSSTRKSSFDQPRSSMDSFVTAIDPTRFSISSSVSSNTSIQLPQPLFNNLFVSNSSKTDAVKYLSNTPPATVHSTFPSGLTQVFLDHDNQCYKAYQVKKLEVVVIRPDGYIGTRVPLTSNQEECYNRLNSYFDSFLRTPVDMNSAAAVVAAGYE